MILSYLGPSVACFWPDQVGPFHESMLTSVVFAGMMVGVCTFGSISDAVGRRKGFLVSASLLGIAGIASAAAPSFISLLLLRTIVGAALGGTPIAVTLFSEFLPTARRGSLVLLLQACWTIGTIGTALLAWAVLPTLGWRWLLIIAAIPMFILLSGYPWLPESPHWLMAQGRVREAMAVLDHVAQVNGKEGGARIRIRTSDENGVTLRSIQHPPFRIHGGSDEEHGDGEERTSLSSSSLRRVDSSHDHESASPILLRTSVVVHDGRIEETTSSTNGATNIRTPPRRLPNQTLAGTKSASSSFFIVRWYRQLRAFTLQNISRIFAPHLARTTSLLWGIWFVNALTYYGLVLLTTTLQSSGSTRPRCTTDGKPNFVPSDYAAVLITSAAEAPGLAVAAFLVDDRGRVWCIRAGLAACAACVLGLLGVTSSVLQLVLLFVARACIEGTFSVLYVYTPELYPTSVRSTGLALCNAFSRLGGFAAPFATVYLVESGRTGTAEVLLGVLLCGAAVAATVLPIETKGVDLGEPEICLRAGVQDSGADHGGDSIINGAPSPLEEQGEEEVLLINGNER